MPHFNGDTTQVVKVGAKTVVFLRQMYESNFTLKYLKIVKSVLILHFKLLHNVFNTFTMKQLLFFLTFCVACTSVAQTLTVNGDNVLSQVEPLIYGAGAEDVNHEIYGGLYDQKIFGEGFEEPALAHIKGFRAYDAPWQLVTGMTQLQTAKHGKIIEERRCLSKGTVEVEVRMDDGKAIAGLIVNVSCPAAGANAFNGYEVSLNAAKGTLVLGKHERNWKLASETKEAFHPTGEWNQLRVCINKARLDIFLNGQLVKTYKDTHHPLTSGYVGLRSYGGSASFRNLKVDNEDIPFEEDKRHVSGMWTASGEGIFAIDSIQHFTGKHSQMISGQPGTGIYNMGLNQWGISMVKGQQLHVSLYLKGTAPVGIALQSSNGKKVYAHKTIEGIGKEWKRFDIDLMPNATDPAGRFWLELGKEGCVWVDQVLLCTDSYPFRADITEAFKQERLTFLRYGGSMVNAPEYMSRHMIGNRLERQPYSGFWYKYATNGFAIPEFVAFARLIGAEPTFAINIEDRPEDVLAMLEEIRPYGLKYIEIGNEENLSSSALKDYEHYVERYLILYEAIHKVWPELQFIHSAWWRANEPEIMKYVFESLDGKCDFWDYHPWTETPLQALKAETKIAEIKRMFMQWNPHTRMRCAVLEENGNTHDMARALAHAVMLNVVRRAQGFVPFDSPANALQPYIQNDNGWDQGQIFFSPSNVWMQPPYYAQQMAATHHQPLLLDASCTLDDSLDYTATCNEMCDTLVLHVVNYGLSPRELSLNLKHFGQAKKVRYISLSGAPKAENTPKHPTMIVPVEKSARPGKPVPLKGYSYTVIEVVAEP